MKTVGWAGALLILCGAMVAQLSAQENSSARRPTAEIKAKAAGGDAESQFELGRLYDRGETVPQNSAEAAKWFRKAAEQGHAKAQYNLAVSYEQGEGVAQDRAEAAKWYRKAAEQNIARAQFSLGACYEDGAGVAKDAAAALQWYRKAAEQNYAPAQDNLGRFYARGIGVAQDAAEAVKWFRRAAEQNLPQAQYNLSVCYDRGLGVTADLRGGLQMANPGRRARQRKCQGRFARAREKNDAGADDGRRKARARFHAEPRRRFRRVTDFQNHSARARSFEPRGVCV